MDIQLSYKLMDQEGILKWLTVKIETTVKTVEDKEIPVGGSGIIYKQDDFPDYVYVFTAMHCIYGENFQYSNSQRYEISKIIVKHKYDNDDCFESFGPFDSSNILLEERNRDVAVLKIPKSKIENIYEHIPKVIIIDGINDERDYILRGYPAVCEEKEVDTKKDKSKAHLIPAIFKERYKNGQFEIEAKPFLASVTGREAFEIIQGLSGCGIFIENTRFLAGIQVELKAKDLNTLLCSNLAFIKKELDEVKIYDFPKLHQKCFTYEKWAEQRQVSQPEVFVPDERRQDSITFLREQLRSPEKSFSVFRIIGLPGVGKTRFIFEVLAPDDLSYKVNYIRAEDAKYAGIFHELLQNDNLPSIVVVDDCASADHEGLVKSFPAKQSKLALITISDNIATFEKPTITLPLKPLTNNKIQELLTEEYPKLDKILTRRLAGLSAGFPDFALSFAKKITEEDGEFLLTVDDDTLMSRFLTDEPVISLEWSRKNKKVLMGLALFSKIGYTKHVIKQAKWLANSDILGVNVDWNDFQEIIREQSRRGIIEEGNYYIHLSQFPLVMYLIRQWWQIYGKDIEFIRLVESIPQEFKSEMIHFFIARLPFMASAEAGKEFIKNLLSKQGVFASGSFMQKEFLKVFFNVSSEQQTYPAWKLLHTDIGEELFVKLLEADPESALICLKRIINSLHHNKEQLRTFSIERGKCRWVILHALVLIASWGGELFNDAARLLFNIGELEDEKEDGSYARGAFIRLFEPSYREPGDLPGINKARTAAFPLERLTILKEVFEADSLTGKRLALKAFQSALKPRNFSSAGIVADYQTTYQGILPLPQLWRPKGRQQELISYFENVWSYFDEHLEYFDEQIRNEMIEVLLESSIEIAIMYPVLSEMLYKTIQKMTSFSWLDRSKLLKVIEEMIYYTEPHIPQDIPQDIVDSWKALQNEIEEKSTFLELFKGSIETCPPYKFNNLDSIQVKISQFAKRAIENPGQLEYSYSWLTTHSYWEIRRLGYELGKLDQKFLLLQKIIEHQRKATNQDNNDFLFGYFNALLQGDEHLWNSSIKTLLKDEVLKQHVPSLLPMTDKNITMLLSFAKTEAFPIESFENFRNRETVKDLSEDMFTDLITFLLDDSSVSGVITALKLFNRYYLPQKEPRPFPTKDLPLRLLLHPVFWLHYKELPKNRGIDYKWTAVAQALIKQIPETEEILINRLIESLGDERGIADGVQNYAIEEFLSEAAKRNPKKLWLEITKYLDPSLKRDVRTSVLERWLSGSWSIRHINKLKFFDPKDIWKWVDGDIEHRVREIAKLVPPILSHSENCLARELLVKYGGKDKEDVQAYFSNHCLEQGGVVCNESLSEFRKNESHPNVQQWINEYIERAKQYEEIWKITDERGWF